MKQNKKIQPFRWVRNLIWDIKFQIREWKLQEQEENEIDQVAFSSKHGGMQGFALYKQFEGERAERKRLHELRKQG